MPPENGTTAGSLSGTFTTTGVGNVQRITIDPSNNSWFVADWPDLPLVEFDENNLEPVPEAISESISASAAVRREQQRIESIREAERMVLEFQARNNMPLSTTARRTLDRVRSTLGGGGAVPKEEKKDRHFNQEERRIKYKPQKDTVKGESVSVDHIEIPA